MSHSRIIRSAAQFDDDAIWRVIEPVFRAGETYPLPRDISRADAFAYWRASGSEVFVAECRAGSRPGSDDHGAPSEGHPSRSDALGR
jgi:hypothetical protein